MAQVQTDLVTSNMIDPGLLKKCHACKKLKELDDFPKNKFSQSGINPYCKTCVKSKQRK